VVHLICVLFSEIGEQFSSGIGCHGPFCRAVFEVLEDDVDADGATGPAKTVNKPGGHRDVGDISLI